MDAFFFKTVKKLKYYVYALVDPRKRQPIPNGVFYIGKGKGNRCLEHAYAERSWKRSKDDPNPKLDLIRKIRKQTGAPPKVFIVCHGLDEQHALRIEAILIKAFKTANKVHGHGSESYWVSADEIEGISSQPVPQSKLPGKTLIVSLNGGADTHNLPPFPDIPKSKVKGRTVGDWIVAEHKAKEIDFVAGVYQQRVVCLYKIRKKTDGTAKFRRYRAGKTTDGRRKYRTQFYGDRCSEEMERSVSFRKICNSSGKILTKFGPRQSWKIIGTRTSKT